jgi:hypothetical protein
MRGKRLTDEQIMAVVRLFPNHTKRELHDMTGVGYSSIDRIQKDNGLRKSREHLHNMGVKAGKASNIARGGKSTACYTPQAIAKRVETYKKRYREEDMRVRWGLPQLTKIRVKRGNKGAIDQASYLRSLGYVTDSKNFVAYYTEKTHRARLLEKLGRGGRSKSARCFFDFKELK